MSEASVDLSAARLRDAGLRVTAPRVAVLEEVTEGGHPTVEQIAGTARKRLGALSTQAVYDVLGVLTEAGLLRRIEPAGSPTRYEARVGDNHHHVVCRRCGAIADIDCLVDERPCLTAADSSGFAVEEAEITFWGLCPSCQPRSDPLGGGHRDHPTHHKSKSITPQQPHRPKETSL